MRNEIQGWRKPSRSCYNGNCVEVGWRKSSHSHAEGNCVEAGRGTETVGVRDTQEAHLGAARTVLEFSATAWREFTGKLKSARN